MTTTMRSSFTLYAEDVVAALDDNDFAYEASPIKNEMGTRFDVSVKAGNAVILCYKTARAVLQGAKLPKLQTALNRARKHPPDRAPRRSVWLIMVWLRFALRRSLLCMLNNVTPRYKKINML